MPRAPSLFAMAALAGLPSAAALAQEGNGAAADQRASGAAILRGAAEAGLGGPQSVGAQLEEDAAQRRTMSRRPGVDAIFNPAEVSLERLREVC